MHLLKNILSASLIKRASPILFSLSFSFTIQAQISPAELKATLILHFCENVTWRTELPNNLTIGCYKADDNLYNFLKPAEKKIIIQQRKIQVFKIENINRIDTLHAIYYGGNDMTELVTLFNCAKQNNVLLITNNVEDELFVLINFTGNEANPIFKVNMPNLTISGFEVKPNLLLNGGSVVDINSAYKQFEERLDRSQEKLKASETALREIKDELEVKDSLLLEKESSLESYIKNIKASERQSKALKKTLAEERSRIEIQHNELKKSQNELHGLKSEIELKESEYKKLESNLDILDKQSDNLQEEISQKNSMLFEQEVQISAQRKMLFMSIFLALAFIIIGIILYRLFSLKKRNNALLAQKVKERTKELQQSNIHYQTLFNLAPVALWESDFSEVKKYTNSLNLNNEEEYDKHVSQNNDFSLECVRRINFINVNNTALNLYGIKGKEEIIEIYEQLHKNGELTGLIPEFKLIYLGTISHTFESVRRNKQGQKLELIVTWVDISEIPGTFKKVILSLVDITHLRQIEKELKRHQNELELIVKEKTEDLESANEELLANNEELFQKNDIINNQNTRLKTTLQHLKETQTQLLQSEKMASLGILTAGVAHEINNPLNYIMGAYEGLKRHNEDTNKSMHSENISVLLNALKTGVDKAANIVKSLNQFSRNNQESNELCNIHEIIESCLTMIQNQLKNRISIEKEYSPESVIVLGNVGNIHQVFLNVFSNAEQAIVNEGAITIRTKKVDENVTIEISDTGQGIEKENIPKITDPFFTTKEPGKGTGLGLSITYNIIKENGGKLEFDSELNKGTTTRITLPLNKNLNER